MVLGSNPSRNYFFSFPLFFWRGGFFFSIFSQMLSLFNTEYDKVSWTQEIDRTLCPKMETNNRTSASPPPSPTLSSKKKSHGFFFFSLFSCLSGGLCTSSNDFLQTAQFSLLVLLSSKFPRYQENARDKVDLSTLFRLLEWMSAVLQTPLTVTLLNWEFLRAGIILSKVFSELTRRRSSASNPLPLPSIPPPYPQAHTNNTNSNTPPSPPPCPPPLPPPPPPRHWAVRHWSGTARL